MWFDEFSNDPAGLFLLTGELSMPMELVPESNQSGSFWSERHEP
jgi:hypothetical protein